MHRYISVIILTIILSSCSSVNINQYEGTQPEFSLYEYFQGQTKGWGIVQDRKGELLRQFVVDIKGTINEKGDLVLDEDFFWRDGEISKRIWTISKTGDKRYSGTADDVVDTASGTSAGNVLNWHYTLNLEVDGTVWKINFDDWMFLQPDDILINKAEMSKFGFKVGEITIVFQKQ